MKNSINKIGMCIFVVALIFMSSAKVNAQKVDQYPLKKVEVGFKFQPVFAQFKMQNSAGDDVTGSGVMGYGAGTFMNYNFTKHLGVQVEMNYNSFSRRYSESDVIRTVNLRYIDIPLLITFNSNKTRKVNLYFVVGPQISVNAGSSVYTTGGEGSVVPHPVLSVRDGNLGIAYGLGADFGLNHKRTVRLGLGLRGVVGLLNISNNSAALNSDSYYIMARTHLHAYSAYFGLSFLL